MDLSAWARSGRAETRDRWAELVRGDQLLCHPVFVLELLHSATDAAAYRQLGQRLDEGFDWVWPDAESAAIAVSMQRRMAQGAPTGQRVKTADLLIAALAARRGVGVLHYDADYDRIRDRGGEPFDSEWLAPRGSLEGAREAATSARRAYSKAFGRRMVQLRNDADLEVWPELIDWMNDQLLARGIDVPPPPDVP